MYTSVALSVRNTAWGVSLLVRLCSIVGSSLPAMVPTITFPVSVILPFVAMGQGSGKFWGFLNGLASDAVEDSDAVTVPEVFGKGGGMKVESCGGEQDSYAYACNHSCYYDGS